MVYTMKLSLLLLVCVLYILRYRRQVRSVNVQTQLPGFISLSLSVPQLDIPKTKSLGDRFTLEDAGSGETGHLSLKVRHRVPIDESDEETIRFYRELAGETLRQRIRRILRNRRVLVLSSREENGYLEFLADVGYEGTPRQIEYLERLYSFAIYQTELSSDELHEHLEHKIPDLVPPFQGLADASYQWGVVPATSGARLAEAIVGRQWKVRLERRKVDRWIDIIADSASHIGLAMTSREIDTS